MSSVTGHCYCKKISFEIQFPTEFISHCHCESCRTSHGYPFLTWGGGIVQFLKSVILFAITLALAGTLAEMTGVVGHEAAKAYRHGGVSFKWLNQQLVGGGHNK
ncbi:MAG: GFA family protein [Pseudobdellovibrionaceae bacterium]